MAKDNNILYLGIGALALFLVYQATKVTQVFGATPGTNPAPNPYVPNPYPGAPEPNPATQRPGANTNPAPHPSTPPPPVITFNYGDAPLGYTYQGWKNIVDVKRAHSKTPVYDAAIQVINDLTDQYSSQATQHGANVFDVQDAHPTYVKWAKSALGWSDSAQAFVTGIRS